MSDLSCPACGTELDMVTLFAHETDQRALARLIAVSVQVRGQAMTIGDALQVVHGGRDPALVKAEADARNAAPMPAAVRQKIAALRGKPTNPDTEGPTP